MAYIREKVLFFTTSPRSPSKMIPEIELLANDFSGRPWNRQTQERFMEKLSRADFFEGISTPKDPALSARDRITRAPKSLGFVSLRDNIRLTDAGRELVYGPRPQEIFLRQLLKYQLPSPYHKEHPDVAGFFSVRPYLEILRLARDLEYLTFDELKIYGMQLTDYRNYDTVLSGILQFRAEKARHTGTYRKHTHEIWTREVCRIYSDKIVTGNTKTRESRDTSREHFIRTKQRNLRDYADACFRYLRFTELVSLSHRNYSISISSERMREANYILATVDRNPVFVQDETAYQKYLFNPAFPVLYGDDRTNLTEVLVREGGYSRAELDRRTLSSLKDLRDGISTQHRESEVQKQSDQLKTNRPYSDVFSLYREIRSGTVYDAPLMFEYNTWRALTILDGGQIQGNFQRDDTGLPLSTAAGNLPDIECDYGDFMLSVEVTLQSGQRQYESEGEPVARHFGQVRKRTGKDTYCLFIAPSVNPAALAHFYTLNRYQTAYYGGKTRIIPLELNQFTQLLDNARLCGRIPGPSDIRLFLDSALEQCQYAVDELEWRASIQDCVNQWLTQ